MLNVAVSDLICVRARVCVCGGGGGERAARGVRVGNLRMSSNRTKIQAQTASFTLNFYSKGCNVTLSCSGLNVDGKFQSSKYRRSNFGTLI